jgi:site-specific DNA recombinase
MTSTIVPPAAVAPIRVGKYLRISLDLQGIGAGIERQAQDTDALAARRGWVGEHYIDNNVSAYDRKTKRPEFLRLVADLKAGRIQGVVVYDIDRLARQPVDLEMLVTLYEAAKGSLVFATCQGDLDLSTDNGVFMARTFVNVANKSSADTARRVARSHLQRAQQGVSSGGNRPFGWADDRLALDPVESALLRKAVDDVIAGVSLHAIIREWNEAGVMTANGYRWKRTTLLRGLMLSPRMAGYRVHQGGIAHSVDGQPVKGKHEPMISVEKWETLRAFLTDPARNVAAIAHPGARKYLLAGLLRCGRCSEPMYGNALTRLDSYFYSCRLGCRSNNITGPLTDETVTSLYKQAIAKNAERAAVERGPWPGGDALADIETRTGELMALFNDKLINGTQLRDGLAPLKRERVTLEEDRDKWRRQSGTVNVDILRDWDRFSVEQQRVFLQRHLFAVVVQIRPRQPGRAKFDPGRIALAWL